MNDFERIANILNELASDNSRNFKKDLLNQHKEDNQLALVFRLAYDPYIKFNVARVVLTNGFRASSFGIYDFDAFVADLDRLVQREKTGNEALDLVRNIYCNVPDKFQPYLEKILQKDLKIGVSTQTINDVWPEWIPEFKVPLCERFKKIKTDKLNFPLFVEPKIDGVRALAFINDSSVEIKARSGIRFDNFKIIEEELSLMYQERFKPLFYHSSISDENKKLYEDGIVIDGEIQDKDFQSTMKNARRLENIQCNNAIFKIWDILSIEEFLNQKSNFLLGYRKRFLLELFCQDARSLEPPDLLIGGYDCYNFRYDHLNLLPWDSVDNMNEIYEMFDYWRSQGEEGIIVKELNSNYFYKRHKNWFKVKIQDVKGSGADYSAEIIEVYPGDPSTKYKDTLGGLKCIIRNYTYDKDDEYNKSQELAGKEVLYHSCDIHFSVGSGFTDTQRNEFWSKKDELVGKIIDVEAQEITMNKHGSYSLRFPIFKGFRGDL